MKINYLVLALLISGIAGNALIGSNEPLNKKQKIDQAKPLTALPQGVQNEIFKWSLNVDETDPNKMFAPLDNIRATSKKGKESVDTYIKGFLNQNKITFNDEVDAYNKYKRYIFESLTQFKPLYIFNDKVETDMRIRLPLTTDQSSYDEYLAFKPKGNFSFNNEQQFKLPLNHAVEIPYLAAFFDKFSKEPNSGLRISTKSCGNIGVENSWFMAKSAHAIPCSAFNVDTVKELESKFIGLTDLKIPQENIHELDLSQVLWVKEGKPYKTLSLKEIGSIVLKSNEYPKK